MRHPIRKACIWFAIVLLGASGILAALLAEDMLGTAVVPIVIGVSIPLCVVATTLFLVALFSAIGHSRLMAGKGVVARWHVGAADWDRFRAFDKIRAAQAPSLVNEFNMRRPTPPGGIDVIVGRRQAVIDGAYHALGPRSLPELRAVYWLPAPADPECLEFAVLYPAGRFGSARRLSLRFPVPASDRASGIRVFEHFRGIIPEFRLGLAFRRPWLVLGCGLGVAALGAGAAGAGWLLHEAGDRSEMSVILQAGGIAGLIGALFFCGIIALVVFWPTKQRP